jgi:hypothetical protein
LILVHAAFAAYNPFTPPSHAKRLTTWAGRNLPFSINMDFEPFLSDPSFDGSFSFDGLGIEPQSFSSSDNAGNLTNDTISAGGSAQPSDGTQWMTFNDSFFLSTPVSTGVGLDNHQDGGRALPEAWNLPILDGDSPDEHAPSVSSHQHQWNNVEPAIKCSLNSAPKPIFSWTRTWCQQAQLQYR